MRAKDLEVTDQASIDSIVKRASICRLSMAKDNHPYSNFFPLRATHLAAQVLRCVGNMTNLAFSDRIESIHINARV